MRGETFAPRTLKGPRSFFAMAKSYRSDGFDSLLTEDCEEEQQFDASVFEPWLLRPADIAGKEANLVRRMKIG